MRELNVLDRHSLNRMDMEEKDLNPLGKKGTPEQRGQALKEGLQKANRKTERNSNNSQNQTSRQPTMDTSQKDTGQKNETETAGTIEVEIPAVVSPNGEVSASYTITEDERGNLKDVTDVGILYDHWWKQEEVPLALVHIKAQIDLDAIFSERVVEGEVEANGKS
jgi:hypothetical protein